MKKTKPRPKVKKHPKPKFPRGWDAKRVQAVIDHYDNQTDEEGAAEYEAGMSMPGQSMILVPTEMVPEIQKLIDSRK